MSQRNIDESKTLKDYPFMEKTITKTLKSQIIKISHQTFSLEN
jgi:hypothetical protein